MSDVFAGTPDERQTDAEATAPEHTLFRKRYRQLSVYELALHDQIKDKANELACLIGTLNPSIAYIVGVDMSDTVDTNEIQNLNCDAANVTLALRHLEDCVYRAVKALTK
jgi:hypothetical protein